MSPIRELKEWSQTHTHTRARKHITPKSSFDDNDVTLGFANAVLVFLHPPQCWK